MASRRRRRLLDDDGVDDACFHPVDWRRRGRCCRFIVLLVFVYLLIIDCCKILGVEAWSSSSLMMIHRSHSFRHDNNAGGKFQYHHHHRMRTILRGSDSSNNEKTSNNNNNNNRNNNDHRPLVTPPPDQLTGTTTTTSSSSSSFWIQRYPIYYDYNDLLQVITSTEFLEPTEWMNLWINPMIEPPVQSSMEQDHRDHVSQLLHQGWNLKDGFETLSDQEVSYIQETVQSSNTHHHPETYGEVTELGARQLFQQMGLTTTTTTSITSIQKYKFYDLGSGVGRLVAQAYMELPHVDRIVGIELGPSRHQIALKKWKSIQNEAYHIRQDAVTAVVLHDDHNNNNHNKNNHKNKYDTTIEDCNFELLEGDLFDCNVSDATHIYLASLCFTDDMMIRIAQKLSTEAHCLQCVATLKEFPISPFVAAQDLVLLQQQEQQTSYTTNTEPQQPTQSQPQLHRIEMTWTKPQGSGCVVYLYFPKNRKVVVPAE